MELSDNGLVILATDMLLLRTKPCLASESSNVASYSGEKERAETGTSVIQIRKGQWNGETFWVTIVCTTGVPLTASNLFLWSMTVVYGWSFWANRTKVSLVHVWDVLRSGTKMYVSYSAGKAWTFLLYCVTPTLRLSLTSDPRPPRP